jgi:hypothetical protein
MPVARPRASFPRKTDTRDVEPTNPPDSKYPEQQAVWLSLHGTDRHPKMSTANVSSDADDPCRRSGGLRDTGRRDRTIVADPPPAPVNIARGTELVVDLIRDQLQTGEDSTDYGITVADADQH